MQVPTRQDVENMPVTMACLQETLRKYTVVPLVTRIASRDTKLCNYDVPKGTKVALHLHGTHNMWKDPESYQPDRFLPGGEFEQFPEDIRRCLLRASASLPLFVQLQCVYATYTLPKCLELPMFAMRTWLCNRTYIHTYIQYKCST
jgi:hypothetical protein